MTVIAWDGKTLAADRQASSNGFKMPTTKIVRRDDRLFAFAGHAALGRVTMEWILSGANPETFPERDKDAWSGVLVVHRSGKVELYDNQPHPLIIERTFHTMGCRRTQSGRSRLRAFGRLRSRNRHAHLRTHRPRTGRQAHMSVITPRMMTEALVGPRAAAPHHAHSLTIMGDPVLKQPAERVASIADVPPGLIADMKRILAREKGLGLAAQQVGSTARVALLKLSGQLVVALNLRIIDRSDEMHTSKREGCLSVQGNGEYFRVDVQRHARVTIEYEAEDFATHTLELVGLDAVIAQHEADHLDGRCIVDGLNRQQRRRAERIVRGNR